MRKKLALIGLGKQNTSDHLDAILKSTKVKLVAVCDKNENQAQTWGEKLKVPYYTDVSELVLKTKLDCAVVAISHDGYLPVIKVLAGNGVHVMKEKPLAMDLKQALEICEIVKKTDIKLAVAVQRKHNKIFNTYLEYSERIGDIFSIHGHYTLNIQRLDEGWRSQRKQSGGGVVIDMGYHLLDLVVWYLGVPDRVSADLGFNNRVGQSYDVEDTAKIQFSYSVEKGRRILGSLLLSRIYPEKEETLSVYGTTGTIKILKDKIELYNKEREVVESRYIKSNGDDILSQLDAFISGLDDDEYKGNYQTHLINMAFIDAVYRSNKESKTILLRKDSRYSKILRNVKAGLVK